MNIDWKKVFEALDHPAIILDPRHNILAANNASTRLTGIPARDMTGKKCYEVFHGRDVLKPPEGCPMEKMLRSNQFETTEMEIEAMGGIFLVSCTPVFDEQGKLENIIHIATEITALRRIEDDAVKQNRQLALREEQLSMIFDNAVDGILLADSESRMFINGNKAISRMLGYSIEELKKLSVTDIHPADDLPYVLEQFGRQVKKEIETAEAIPIKRKDGSIFFADISSSPVAISGRHCLLGFFRDTTARKITEDLILKERDFSETALNSLPGIFYMFDQQGRFIRWNNNFEIVTGYSPTEIVSMHPLDLFAGDDKILIRDAINKVFTTGSAEAEALLTSKGGEQTAYYFSGRTIKVDGEQCLIGMGIDITRQREAVKALAFSEKRFRDLLETIQLAAVMLDLEGNIIFCNNFFLLMTGWTRAEVVNRNSFDLFLPAGTREELRKVFARAIKDVTLPNHYETSIITREGNERLMVWDNTFFYDEQGKLAGTASIGIDITENRKVEEQLRQAQKMEAIGHLAGGVAHDFNNILTAIIGYGSLLGNMIPADSGMHDYVTQILASAEKAASLTHSLLAFSRKQVIHTVPVNIRDVVTGMQKMLARVIGEDIRISLNNFAGDLIVRADRSRLEQVLMNLATNSRDAMPKGGLLTVTTEEVEIDEEFIRRYRYGEPGSYAVISFSDTGSGMDTKTKDNMFEPFFTTKEVGKGTGLGLAMVYGTIKQHNGFINVYSEPGEGTTFRIYLPLIKDIPEGEIIKSAPTLIRGDETILLVEDDETVRQVTKAMLEESGYTVIEAGNSEEAVRIFSVDPGKFQLVISDIIMPGQNGRELYEALRKTRSDLKALFISGYSADMLTKKGVLEGSFNFLSKPLRAESFSKKLRDILDG